MPSVTLRGLSWGHRRASGSLPALTSRFRQLNPDVEIVWQDRTLAGFEHQAIEDLVGQHDLIIYDHPFSGDIAKHRCFVQLDSQLSELRGQGTSRFVAKNVDIYRFDGAVWGAPIDAATQHAIIRRDLLPDGEATPVSWCEMLQLGARLSARGLHLGSAFKTPHAGLMLGSLMANLGRPWTPSEDGLRLDPEALDEGLKALAGLHAFCPAEVVEWDAIDLHERMVGRDDIVFAPCTYGYATYGEADMRRRLGFADFPGIAEPYFAGTAIGGTAIGVSAVSPHRDEALAFVRFVLSDEAQNEIIPAHHGQSALRQAWDNPHWVEVYNGYHRDVRRTIDAAWVRPRVPSYIPFQAELGSLLAAWLRGEFELNETKDRVRTAAARVRPA